MGQLVGRGIAAIHNERANVSGVPGRANATVCMDEALTECVISFEGRPRCEWSVPDGTDIDGFVDAWYGENNRVEGWATGTNLRQFLDGFAVGSKSTISISIRQAGNLHHLYEAVFRALGDAVNGALGNVAPRIKGDTSGLAGPADYTVELMEND
jgi:imidazoleglycerol phosphate dehydratase HisB